METVDTLTIEDLAVLLRHYAKGVPPLEAATELLIRSDVWLLRQGFRDACVVTWGPTAARPHAEVGARVDWVVVGEALAAYAASQPAPEWLGVCSGGERRLLGVVHDIAAGPMGEVAGLDRGKVALVLAAVSHAAGSHEHHPHPFTEHPDGTVSMSENRWELLGPLFRWPPV